MRNEPALQGRMAGIASFLEGLVALRTGDNEGAAKQFAIAAGGRFPKVSDAFAVSERMLKYGFPEQSALLLKTIESQYSNDVQFWAQLTTAAYESRQMDIMTRAAKKTMDLAPNELIYVNNYAAVLLALRQNPEEAVKLTFRLILKSPENRDYQINHSLALVQNARLEEAETLLKRFNPATMNPVEAASVNLAWFVIHLRRGNVAQAREVVRAIDTSRLMEPQVRWIGEQIKKLETR
jgi:tetratricopeptide (TPR) repeat protein